MEEKKLTYKDVPTGFPLCFNEMTTFQNGIKLRPVNVYVFFAKIPLKNSKPNTEKRGGVKIQKLRKSQKIINLCAKSL
jgi:hypothetical protein